MTEPSMSPDYYREPAILPLGRDLGLIADASGSTRGHLQLGPNDLVLEADHYATWRAAHHATDLKSGRRHNKGDTIEAASQAGVVDAERILRELIEQALIVQASGDNAISLALQLRAVPSATGIGPVSGGDGLSAIGFGMDPIVVIPDSVLEVMVWSGVELNLMFACSRAIDRTAVESTERYLLDPVFRVEEFLYHAQDLIAVSALWLDIVSPRDQVGGDQSA